MHKTTESRIVVTLMGLSALAMFGLAVYYTNWAPAVTGIGFAVTAWGFGRLK